MKVKALISFCGKAISMGRDEVREVTDKVASDLISCGYAQAVEEKKAEPPENSGEAPENGEHNADAEEAGEVSSDENKRGKSKRG